MKTQLLIYCKLNPKTSTVLEKQTGAEKDGIKPFLWTNQTGKIYSVQKSCRETRVSEFRFKFIHRLFKNNTTLLVIFTNMFWRYIRHRQCEGYESLQWFKTCLLQIIRLIAMENNMLDKKISKLTELKDARARAASWLRSGFPHLMYIDSVSLTLYLLGAESKILKQSRLRRSVRGQVLVHARGPKCRLVRLHKKICTQCACGACQGEATLNKFFILKVE